MGQPWDAVARAADKVAERLGRASVGVVLGSGLSECLESLDRPRFMEFSSIPGMPAPTTSGHRGAVMHAHQDGTPVLALCGRIHLYEGRSHDEVALGVRMLSALGVHTLVVTSAVTSLDEDLAAGQMMLVEDHVNQSGTSVLMGEHEPRFGPRFPDMVGAYDEQLLDVVQEVGVLAGVELGRGVLAHVHGPAYETPAEAKLARLVGARVASMSMVPEVEAARQRGMRVVGLACVTNVHAGRRREGRENEVLASNARLTDSLQTLLSGVIPRLGKPPERRAVERR